MKYCNITQLPVLPVFTVHSHTTTLTNGHSSCGANVEWINPRANATYGPISTMNYESKRYISRSARQTLPTTQFDYQRSIPLGE